MSSSPRSRSVHSTAALGAAVAAAALLGAGCPEKDKDPEDPGVIATVNGEIVSRAEFEQELARESAPADSRDAPPTAEQAELVKRTLLNTIVDRILLIQVARLNNVTVGPEEVDRGVLRISSDYPAEGFSEALAQGQLSMAELKQKTAALLTIEKLF